MATIEEKRQHREAFIEALYDLMDGDSKLMMISCNEVSRAARRRWRREHPEAWARSERQRRARKRERQRQEQLRAELRPFFQQLARRLREQRSQ